MRILLTDWLNEKTTTKRNKINGPFGLSRFAKDHSLTKATSGPLLVRFRLHATQTQPLHGLVSSL